MDYVVDIETRSGADLNQLGARKYISHASTQLLMLVARGRTLGDIRIWAPNVPYQLRSEHEISYEPKPPQWVRSMFLFADRLIGHNCYNFDAPFLEHHYGLTGRWYDTMHAARASGLPGSLDAIGEILGVGRKDKRGDTLIKMLCWAKENAHGQYMWNISTVEAWSQFLAYNIQDVMLTDAVYEMVKDAEEPDVVRVDRTINERGLKVDGEWLNQLLKLWDELAVLGGDRIAELTQGALTRDNVASVPKVRAWLLSQNANLASLNRKALEALYEDPEEVLGECDDAALIVEVLKLRQSMTRAMKGKLKRLVDTMDRDCRVRDWRVYYGAHTGRFTSRRVQLHNLARGVKVDVEAILKGPRTLASIQELTGGYDSDDVLASLVRPVFIASPGKVLAPIDYASVEARGLAWLADEPRLLEVFADPKRDIYCEFASQVFGRTITKEDKIERQVGKTCILGLGYMMGPKRLREYMKSSGIDLDALGLTAESLVQTYRNSYPRIPALWRELIDQCEMSVRYGNGLAARGRILFTRTPDATLRMRLPSGRSIMYRNCHIARRVPHYVHTLGLVPFEKDVVIFTHPRKYEGVLFGGSACENAIQGLTRDILVDGIIALETRGFPVVLDVHDEIVPELDEPDEIHAVAQTISTPPAWAEGFPLRVEGFTCPRYVKAPWSDSVCVDYCNGEEV